MTPVEVMPFDGGDADVIDAAARLLAARHRAHRLAEPGLDPRFEDPAAARAEIETLAAREGASGSVARRGGAVTGYLLGTPRSASWGPNMWVEGAGHAIDPADPEVIRDLYGHAAGHPTVVTDWRETNLLSSRTWPRLGFRPTFGRLFRAIA